MRANRSDPDDAALSARRYCSVWSMAGSGSLHDRTPQRTRN